MTTPFPQPDDVGSLARRVRALERQLALLDGARRLAAATISEGGLTVAGGGGIRIIGGGDIDVADGGSLGIRGGGGLEVTGGGGLDVSGGGDVNVGAGGSLIVQDGDLVLGAGKIEGAALDQQLSGIQASNTAAGFSVTNTSYQNKVSVSVPVPSWATVAFVMATATIRARMNESAMGDDSALLVRPSIAGNTGGEVATYVFPLEGTYYAYTSASWSATVNDPGSSFTVSAQARAEHSSWYPSSGSNQGEINALVIFMRGGPATSAIQPPTI